MVYKLKLDTSLYIKASFKLVIISASQSADESVRVSSEDLSSGRIDGIESSPC